ncbi:cytidine deaminase [Vibrio sp. SCSIO 43137]|uniref:cytidine deaminase n=1 Tax=Vibrio sp. SCSIO 43137 TaxID=3021011 RepID=UPI002307A8FA|nr:cytidine deaminase [Vibrio sp. SCSIO 43137]WCE30999.1 cytidine deaminase [Vibrio sp. SCSIO 43137]
MNSRIETALKEAPSHIASYLENIFKADDFDATISKQQFEELLELSGLEDNELRVALLPFAAAYSYAPISNFYVGSIVRGLSGRIYFGANMELIGAQLGQTVHAEQAGISHAWMKGEKGVQDITINYSPCGHCRQFMNELTTAKELIVQLPQRDEQTLQEYLPESFGPSDLDIDARLMGDADLGHSTEGCEPLLAAAVESLNMSHSPYTENFSGVALELDDGSVYRGAYAENAAFNPSLPPLQVALIQIMVAGKSFEQIKSAALAELSSGKISHLACTQSTLDVINPDIPLSYIEL